MKNSKYLTAMLGGILTASLMVGCIREDRSDCPPTLETRSVVVKVMDSVGGRDITESGEAGGAELYLFTREGDYAGHVAITNDDIMRHVPVRILGRDLDDCWLSVWTNTGTGQQFYVPDEGVGLEDRAVSLIVNDGEYHGIPDNMFFGRLQLASSVGTVPEVVTVMRKNARMHITVRGLDAAFPGERYYFTVRTPDDGYDFNGNPMTGEATVRSAGMFDVYGDFSTTEAFNVIHTDPNASWEDNKVTVCVYEKSVSRAADRLVVSAVVDDDGTPISLPMGQTVNLLIDISENAGLSVRTEITPWNEIYQWESW